MAYTINGNIPCGTEACTGREHTPAGACNSVYDIILDAIKEIKGEMANVDSLAKEATLLAKVAELKEALNNIDFTDLETAIGEVKDVVANIDFSALAKEDSLLSAKDEIISAVENSVQQYDSIIATQLDSIIG